MFNLTEKNRKWWILFAMTSSISMIFIDLTVLPVSLPTIQRLLNFTPLGLQWIVNAYTLSLTVFVLAAGRFGDRYGHRLIFCWGLLIFSIGSIMCGLSYHEWWFILSRVIQGIGGAMLIPSTASLIFSAFPPHQRGKALGLYTSVGTIFLAFGPFIGGLFSQYASWRFIFWINIPIALIGLILTLFAVPKSKPKPTSFDLLGFLTSSIGISFIIIALMQANHWGWTSFLTLGFITVGIILLILLLIVDRQEKNPYIDVFLFKNRNFSGAVFAVFLTQFFLMITVYWAIYFQNVFHYTPMQAGLLSFVSNIPVILSAPLGGHLLDKHGPRLPIAIGFFLVIGSLFWFLQNLDNPNVWIILSAITPFGFGIPFILTPSYATALGEVAPERRGLASGSATMLRQAGAAFGLAIITSVFLTVQSSQFEEDLQKNIATAQMSPKSFRGLLSKAPQALENLKKLPPQAQTFVKQSFTHSYMSGFWAINALAIVTALCGLGVSMWLIRKKTEPDIEM